MRVGLVGSEMCIRDSHQDIQQPVYHQDISDSQSTTRIYPTASLPPGYIQQQDHWAASQTNTNHCTDPHTFSGEPKQHILSNGALSQIHIIYVQKAKAI